MSNFKFASLPNVNIARSKFHRTQAHNNSFNLGELTILGFDEVIPGSTHKVELGSLIRMSNPIAPIMDDIQMDIYSFFVPIRLTWDHWKNFMGESEAAGVSPTTYTIPAQVVNGSMINSIADDLGIPPFRSPAAGTYNQSFEVSVLPFRAIPLIINRFFRNQNVEAPLIVDKSDNADVLVGTAPGWGNEDTLFTGLVVNPGGITSGAARPVAYKLPDYITSCLPYAQKGDPVQIFGDNALSPVITSGNTHISSGYSMHFVNGSNVSASPGYLGLNGNGDLRVDSGSFSPYDTAIPNNLWANLSASVNTTINDLRFAFQLQKALERDALYGSYYWSVLRAHYGVTSPDATLQDPELLGHIKFDINISQVLQTTGFTSPTATTLGTPGANSVTANRDHLCTASFTEHGYLIHIGVARQKRHTYSNSLNRLWSRKTRWDFYHPVFANLGAQKVLVKEVFSPQNNETLGLGETTFGFQDRWNEYRFLPSYNSGLLNPYRSGALDYWTLADRYTTTPTLSASFLKESRDNLAAALVTGVAGPDFIGSFYFKDTVVNPMPLYSIPGFADHH